MWLSPRMPESYHPRAPRLHTPINSSYKIRTRSQVRDPVSSFKTPSKCPLMTDNPLEQCAYSQKAPASHLRFERRGEHAAPPGAGACACLRLGPRGAAGCEHESIRGVFFPFPFTRKVLPNFAVGNKVPSPASSTPEGPRRAGTARPRQTLGRPPPPVSHFLPPSSSRGYSVPTSRREDAVNSQRSAAWTALSGGASSFPRCGLALAPVQRLPLVKR